MVSAAHLDRLDCAELSEAQDDDHGYTAARGHAWTTDKNH
eukprot:SAG31_NODE_14945_length_779_cov_0.869118_2_plen_40_part_01